MSPEEKSKGHHSSKKHLVTNKENNHDTPSNTNLIHSPLSITEVIEGAGSRPLFPVEQMVEYFGVVNYSTNERVLQRLKYLITKFPTESLYLIITSAGGPCGTAMSFYDTVHSIMRPNLVTIGSGDVDSSAMLLFLTGGRRYVTAHTTALLHRAGRVFDTGKRMTSAELSAMAHEDLLKDRHYAAIVSECSGGRLKQEQVLQLMDENTTLLPADFISYGLADAIID